LHAAARISCVSSRCAGSAWKQAASCQRPSLTTPHRIKGDYAARCCGDCAAAL